MWVRGLKLLLRVFANVFLMSHPMWVRGLKQSKALQSQIPPCVAPHVGAWIETKLCAAMSHAALGRPSPMWVRGLKTKRNKTIFVLIAT